MFEQAWKLSRGDTVRVVRRATVVLDASTRDGDREVHVLTSLPSEVNAAQVATLYLSRWTIESAFADLARWLDAEIAPLGYPRAARLGFCVGLMAYNAVSTLLGALRVTHGEDVVREQVSRYYLAQFGRDAVGAVDELVEEDAWGRWRGLTLLAAAALLKETAARIDLRMVRKHARGPKKPVPKRTRYKNEPHVATARLLNGAAKEDQPKKVKKAR